MADLLESAARTAVAGGAPAAATPERSSTGPGGQDGPRDAGPRLPDPDLLREHGVLTEVEFAAVKGQMRARRRRFQVATRPGDGAES